MKLFPSKEAQRFFEKVEDIVNVFEERSDSGSKEHKQKIALEGVALILLALERICLLLSIGVGLLLSLLLK